MVVDDLEPSSKGAKYHLDFQWQSVALAVVRTPSSEHPEPLAAFESAALWRHPPWWINA